MKPNSIPIRLEPLDAEHVENICRLLKLQQETVQGYLAEEVFGWSMSRVVLVESVSDHRIVGLIQVSKLNVDKGYGVLGTWLVPQVWGTGANAAAKQMILAELFATYPHITRVYLCIESTNTRSLMAARKLPYAGEITEAEVPLQLVSELANSNDVTGCYWFVIRQDHVAVCHRK